MPKINPESVILQQLDGQKLVGRDKAVKVTAEDIQRCAAEFGPDGPVVFTHGHSDSIEFSIVDVAAAKRLAEHDARTRGAA